MSRQTERRERINNDVLPLARKLRDEHLEHHPGDKDFRWAVYQLMRFCRAKYCLSVPVARDYADQALIILESESNVPTVQRAVGAA